MSCICHFKTSSPARKGQSLEGGIRVETIWAQYASGSFLEQVTCSLGVLRPDSLVFAKLAFLWALPYWDTLLYKPRHCHLGEPITETHVFPTLWDYSLRGPVFNSLVLYAVSACVITSLYISQACHITYPCAEKKKGGGEESDSLICDDNVIMLL